MIGKYNWPLRTDLGRLFGIVAGFFGVLMIVGMWIHDSELATLGFGGILAMCPIFAGVAAILNKHDQ